MGNILIRGVLGVVIFLPNLLLTGCTTEDRLSAQEEKSSAMDTKLEELVSEMTLEEKVGQMTQITLDVVGKGQNRYASDEPFQLDTDSLRKALVEHHIGSVLNTANVTPRTPEKWHAIIRQIQDMAMNETRMQIPVIYGVDAIHGATYTTGATMIPQQINQAASFDRELVRKGAAICAYETRAGSIPWNFSPVLDLGSDPRAPRQWETFGEDPYLGAELGKQMIKGYEGEHNDLSHPEHVASCMKHFLGYQTPVSGKDRTPAYIPDAALYEYHLPAFRAAVEAGSKTIMISSGIINGIPVHANPELLTGLLKEELDFEGFVVTDWADIENLYTRDHLASSHKEAIMMAVNAGVDMSMVPYQYERFYNNLIELVREGKVKQERIDDAVKRILKVKLALNLFDVPYTEPEDYPEFASEEFEQTAYDLAAGSVTLLKNENNLLPLSNDVSVLLAGPNANSMRPLNGGWTYSWQGEKADKYAEQYNTILEALQQENGVSEVTYLPGVSYDMDGQYWEEYEDRIDETIAAADNADVIILCLGENSYAESQGNLQDLYLSDLQTKLAKELSKTGKPVVLVLNEGRPRIISRIEEEVPAIIQTYLPANYGADALVDILFGKVNPSGKLPYTYPRYPNSIISHIHKYSEEGKRGEGQLEYDLSYNPQFEFGYGLSYTSFSYSNLIVENDSISPGETIVVSVDVTNTGERAGKEVVQLYISDLYASKIVPDIKRLRGFDKVLLEPGETKSIKFSVKPEDLAYAALSGDMVLEPGTFRVQVDTLEKDFVLSE